MEAVKMVEVTPEDANNYCEVLRVLGMDEEGDPVQGIQMLQSWEAEAQARAELLEQHLRAALEVAHKWQPNYATKMDLDTLQHAKDCADRKVPDAQGAGHYGDGYTIKPGDLYRNEKALVDGDFWEQYRASAT